MRSQYPDTWSNIILDVSVRGIFRWDWGFKWEDFEWTDYPHCGWASFSQLKVLIEKRLNRKLNSASRLLLDLSCNNSSLGFQSAGLPCRFWTWQPPQFLKINPSLSISINVYVYIDICTYICIHLSIYMHTYICVYVYKYILLDFGRTCPSLTVLRIPNPI